MSDPLLLDAPALRTLASDAIVRRGIDYFQEHRVTDLRVDGRQLTALVDGSAPYPYELSILADEDDELLIDCDCPFDWEPACKHAVAALLAYSASQPVPDVQVEGAADAAVEARVKRGRTQVAVRHVAGDPFFGIFEARSMGGGSGRPHRVQIVSLTERINHCSCPDLATNRLGTCKHVEAVLHHLKGKRGARRRTAEGPPHAAIHLAWDVPEAPAVRLLRPKGGGPDLLDRFFDDAGRLSGAVPDAVHALQRAVAGRDDVVITPDVMGYAQHLAEEAAHRERGRLIHAQITRSGGRLPGVDATLYPYQVQGVAFLAAAGRALLADDMGLGKTLQALAAATWLVQNEGVRRVLVVCPASLEHQWEREITRFTNHAVQVVQGPPATRLSQYRQHAAFTIVNYEVVLRDAAELQRHLAPDLLVLDEAQRIKNRRTKTAAAIKDLDTRYAFVLTGTPLENRLEDLYSLMQVVDPRVLGPLWRYLVDFHVTTDTDRVVGYRNLSELRRRLSGVMLRRDRRLVRDQLPDRIDQRVDVELDARQQQLHDEALQTAQSILSAAARQGRPLTPTETHRVMAALQNARMACDAAGLVDKETEGSPKLAELGKLLEELCLDGGHKVVVFSKWTRMTERAGEVARRLGLGVAHLHGGIPTARRGELIDRFRDDPGCQVFLSTDAGGVGLNLQCATALVNLDVPWNPAVLEQRIARLHRLGQSEPVQVVQLVAIDAYEGRVAQLVEGKRVLFRHTVTEDATEDVVGLSKRSIETALAALDADVTVEVEDAPAAEPAMEPSDDEAPDGEVEQPGVASGVDPSLAPVLAALERALAGQVERVMATGGGLLVVVDTVDAEVEALADSAAVDVDIAVIDARTAAALGRIGGLPGVSVTRPVADHLATARRPLRAAEALVGARCDGEALTHLCTAALAILSRRAGRAEAPPVADAARWVHGELVPSGHLDADEAMTVTRALLFAGAPEVPTGLAAAVLTDLRRVAVDASGISSTRTAPAP